MRPKVILNLLFFLFCCTAVQAQTGRQITGKVIDAMGELPGVSVVISRPLKSAHLRNIVRKQYPADFFNKPQKSPHGSFEVVCGGS